MKTKELLKNIESKNFNEAIDYLKQVISEGKEEDVSTAYYYLSYIYACLDNKNRDLEEAKKYSLLNINSKYPDYRCYLLISKLEEDKNISINFLKKGISIFPSSISIYKQLLVISKSNDKIQYALEIKDKKIIDVELFELCLKILIENKSWNNISYFTDYIINDANYKSDYRNIFKIIKSISLIKLYLYEDAEILLNEIIKDDLENKFNYISQVLLLWDYSFTNNEVKFFDILDNINPECIDNVFMYNIDFEFGNLLSEICDDLLHMVDKDKKLTIKIKSIPIFYKNNNWYEREPFKHSDLNILKKFNEYFDSKQARKIIIQVQKELKKFDELYATMIKMYENSELDEYTYYSYSKISEGELNSISDKMYDYIRNHFIDKSYINYIFDPIIDELWKLKNFEIIASLCQNIDSKLLLNSRKLFELAYSLNENHDFLDVSKSQYLYEEYLKKNPNSTAVLNNLGLIYKTKGDYLKAKELFERGLSIDKNDKFLKNNYSSVNKISLQLSDGYENIKKEPFYVIEKFSKIISCSPENHIIEIGYNDWTNILKCSYTKAKELMQKFQDKFYLIKQDTEQYQKSKYIINKYVIEYVLTYIDKINLNKIYENKAIKINIENFENIGYLEIRKNIKKINNEKIRKIVTRDLEECAYSYLLGFNKTTIIMSGSIIESILVDLLLKKGIIKYNIGAKIKNVNDMDLIDLLEVSNKEELIKDTTYHLSHILRKYRNIIHPCNEIKNAYDVDENISDLLWNALKTVIKEVF